MRDKTKNYRLGAMRKERTIKEKRELIPNGITKYDTMVETKRVTKWT